MNTHRIEQVRTAKIENLKVNAPKRVGLFEDAFSGKSGARACIKAFCFDCQGYDAQAVKNCDAYACPLWNQRPYSGIKRRKGAKREATQSEQP